MNTHQAIIICLISLFTLYILCRVFIKPIKWILKLLISCFIGLIAMFLSNKLLLPFGIAFSLNPLTSIICGVLGLPGMAIIIILQNIL